MVTVSDVVGIYSVWLIVFATVGNLATFFICCQLRKNTTFVFFAFMAISDMISVYYWNLKNFLLSYFAIDISQNITVCRIGSYIQFVSQLISAWLLILLSLDRLLSLMTIKWKNYFKPKQAIFVCAGCVMFFVLGCLNVILNYGGTKSVNGTTIGMCFSIGDPQTAWMSVWDIVNSLMYSYIPFAILLLINCRLIYEFSNRQVKGVENDASRKRKRAMNRTVIFVTLLFIIMTLPMAVMGSIYSFLIKQSYGQAIILIFGRVSSSYQAYSIIILYFTNQKFAQRLRMCFMPKRFQIAPSSFRENTKSQTQNTR